MAAGDKIKWNEADFKWDDNPHLWNLVVEVAEAIQSGVDHICIFA